MGEIIANEGGNTAAGLDANIHWRDYYELTKPKVLMLMILTSVIGMFMATPSAVPWDILLFGNVGLALCAGSAATVNHLVDRRIDGLMARTKNRPIATGKLPFLNAVLFASLLAVVGMAILIIFVNQRTAWLTFGGLLGYAVVYTLWLKRATPQNIVIGGLAGAIPPLIGWVAVTNSIDGHGLLLALIIFAWTPPHFWALAIARKEEYAKVDIPMLPVTHGVAYTRLQIIFYTLLMIIVSLLPFATRLSGWLYLLGALVLGAGFMYWSVILYMGKDKKAPMQTFKYSIIYLMALYLIMLFDHWLIAKVPPNVVIGIALPF